MTDDTELNRLQVQCDDLITQHQTLLIATRADDGRPDISYAPYVRKHTVFYILVSELARHTRNMRAYPDISILFIQPEQQASNVFARRRLTLQCRVSEVSIKDSRYVDIVDLMTTTLGETVRVLTALSDFHLMALTPIEGLFVAGFGKAFPVDAHLTLMARPAPDRESANDD